MKYNKYMIGFNAFFIALVISVSLAVKMSSIIGGVVAVASAVGMYGSLHYMAKKEQKGEL